MEQPREPLSRHASPGNPTSDPPAPFDQPTPSHKYIMVLGVTGSGSSSTINAVLDEQLLPTNGFSACTTVPTQVAYNESNDPAERYIAHITLRRSAATDEAVGTTHTIKSASLPEFRKLVRPYVDALWQKMHPNSGPPDHTNILLSHVETVRLLTRSDVLKSGVVFVDHPGFQIWTTARATVAGPSFERCTSVWVVHDMVRGLDNDMAAFLKHLLHQKQANSDAIQGSVTLVYSKSDAASTEEMMREHDVAPPSLQGSRRGDDGKHKSRHHLIQQRNSTLKTKMRSRFTTPAHGPLPMFCTSSRAYAIMTGQTADIDQHRASGFLREADTEIPQLRMHAMQLVINSLKST